MKKHTEGTWKVRNGREVFCGNKRICDVNAASREPLCIADDLEVAEANARLIASAPDLLEAQTMGQSLSTPDFLDWVADRLVHKYGENPNVDFVLSLRERAAAGRAAIAKATGVQA